MQPKVILLLCNSRNICTYPISLPQETICVLTEYMIFHSSPFKQNWVLMENQPVWQQIKANGPFVFTAATLMISQKFKFHITRSHSVAVNWLYFFFFFFFSAIKHSKPTTNVFKSVWWKFCATKTMFLGHVGVIPGAPVRVGNTGSWKTLRSV